MWSRRVCVVVDDVRVSLREEGELVSCGLLRVVWAESWSLGLDDVKYGRWKAMDGGGDGRLSQPETRVRLVVGRAVLIHSLTHSAAVCTRNC